MSALAHALSDSATMTRRDLRRALRYPVMTITGMTVPIVLLLLFNYVFGRAIGAGLGGSNGGNRYIDYLAPAIVLMTVGSGTAGISINISADMTEGIVNRFRTMAIFRASVLIGQVIGGMIRTMISVVLVLAVALLVGFRPTAGPVEWLAALGLIALFAFALTWLAVALGLLSTSPAAANTSSMPAQFLLPFTSSAFVPVDSLPSGLRWFAERQPFTLVIDTLRGLLLGTPIGHSAALAVAWCAGIALVGYLWARAIFNRDPVR
jgi:ABC-2 type transport system permease protein